MKTTTYAIGSYEIEFDAPSIKKQFWFGEDARSVEEWNEAQRRVEACETEDYFIRENMARCNAARYINALDGIGEYGRPRAYRFYVYEGKPFVEVDGYGSGPSYAGAHELDDSERMQLKEASEAELAKFEKRLRSYLKRYGLSKCDFSTFWINR